MWRRTTSILSKKLKIEFIVSKCLKHIKYFLDFINFILKNLMFKLYINFYIDNVNSFIKNYSEKYLHIHLYQIKKMTQKSNHSLIL